MDKRAAAWVAVSAAAALLLCGLLYVLDNKYTRPGPQPVSGLLVLPGEVSLLFPWREWEYYPGRLLGPEDFASGGPGGYRVYTDIGRRQTDRGTYRLLLDLPLPAREWALEVPEVFSACRLYIGGELRLALGSPDAGDYRPAVQSRVITFTGGGRVEVLLAASNASHLYGGLVYPPALGMPSAVNARRASQQLLHAVAVAIALLFAAMFLALGLRGGEGDCLLFAGVCLLLAGYLCYPLVHCQLITNVRPWYAGEIFCGWALLVPCAMLHRSLCGIRSRALPIACAVFACGAGLAALLLPGSAAGAQAFAGAAEAFRLIWCVWMLAAARYGMRRGAAPPLLAGTVFYTVCLAMDRLLPLYEPAVSGWFGEVGGCGLAACVGGALWARLLEAYRLRPVYEKSLLEERRRFDELAVEIGRTRAARHDLRHHLAVIESLLAQRREDELRDYLARYVECLPPDEPLRLCENAAVDALLSRYRGLARGAGVRFDVSRLTFPQPLEIGETDLCALLGNLLENALRAARACPDGFIRLTGAVIGQNYVLMVENRFAGEGPGEEGTGLASVRAVAQRYGGQARFEADRTVFTARAVLVNAPAGAR